MVRKGCLFVATIIWLNRQTGIDSDFHVSFLLSTRSQELSERLMNTPDVRIQQMKLLNNHSCAAQMHST